MLPNKVPTWLPPVAAGALMVGLFIVERQRPLRPVRPKPDVWRVPRNFIMAASVAAVVRCCERPLVDPLARWVARRGLGLLPRLRLAPTGQKLLGLLLLDYTLYGWHVLLHRQPLLWRGHVVHHADLVLDSSTAFRFHAWEFLASVPWRLMQVAMLGVAPPTLNLWRRLTFIAVIFHHSNVRIPARLEKLLSLAIMTPRLHGIHHSVVRAEADSNFSSGLTVWDRLHGTLRDDVPQDRIEIGVPEHRDGDKLRLVDLLTMPFKRPPGKGSCD